ncbi:MAG: hypothetical protein KKB34_16505 [Bacteroidetes bacterium]|jgi:hypothetical protein|nr:hypothetical protein [Bacteroidota bacterium]
MVLGIIFIVVGIYFIVGITFRWDWFKEQPKVQRVANFIGKDNIYTFYFILGFVLIVTGLLKILLTK